MRPLSLAIPTGLLLLLAADAAAQSTPYPVVKDTSISSVQVTGQARTERVYQEHLDAVKGQYALSNGWRLKVDSASNGVKAKIDNQRPMYLVAITPDKYVSRDGNVEMEFNRGEGGYDMLMSYVPTDPATGARLAQVIVVKATMAQR